MNKNPLLALSDLGQSVWIDYLDRSRLSSGQVRRHIDEDGLRGITSNPTIFEKAITGRHDYDAPIRELALRGQSPAAIYEALTVEDIQRAADTFRPVFERLGGRDGFVSLEVSPHLAQDTRRTIEEARRLWAALDRPNVMIKVPATRAGLPAIRQLIGEGINVNVTLLFGLGRYQEVAEAYLSGLEARIASGEAPNVASVASFFLSRIDVMVDAELEALTRAGHIRPELAARLRGEVAIASARVAYRMYGRTFAEERFRKLASKGARPQRLLWASTSKKDPAYSDVKYVEALIGAETIVTMPLGTFDAYRDHGRPMLRLVEDPERAQAILDELGTTGIDLGEVTQRLEEQGARKFVESYDHLLEVIAERRATALHAAGRAMTL